MCENTPPPVSTSVRAAFSNVGFENFVRAKTGSIAVLASSMIWRLVTPGRMRVMTALRYSRMNWSELALPGAYLPLTGQTRPMSLV